jgi:hypothetical protein
MGLRFLCLVETTLALFVLIWFFCPSALTTHLTTSHDISIPIPSSLHNLVLVWCYGFSCIISLFTRILIFYFPPLSLTIYHLPFIRAFISYLSFHLPYSSCIFVGLLS